MDARASGGELASARGPGRLGAVGLLAPPHALAARAAKTTN